MEEVSREDSQYIMPAYAAVKIHLKIQCILILMFILFFSCKDTNPVLCLIRGGSLVFVARFIDSMGSFLFFLHYRHISFFRFLLFLRKAFENIFPVFCIGFRWAVPFTIRLVRFDFFILVQNLHNFFIHYFWFNNRTAAFFDVSFYIVVIGYNRNIFWVLAKAGDVFYLGICAYTRF